MSVYFFYSKSKRKELTPYVGIPGGKKPELHRYVKPPLTQRRSVVKGKRASLTNAFLPKEWDYTLMGLSKINREGIDAIREAVGEAFWLSLGADLSGKLLQLYGGHQRRFCPPAKL